jgi:hypothetical protein
VMFLRMLWSNKFVCCVGGCLDDDDKVSLFNEG